MTFAQTLLRLCHPKAEKERMQMRRVLARAQAEAEDVTRTVKLDSERLQTWLRENDKVRQK